MNESQLEIFDDFSEIVITAIIVFILVLMFKMIEVLLNKVKPVKQRSQGFILRTFK